MKKFLTVRILVSVPDPARFDACTLVFDTLRIGFPTAKIHVDINGLTSRAHTELIEAKAQAADCFTRRLTHTVHHAEWIKNSIEGHIFDWPLILLDADTIFWKSVEDWEFPADKLLAGYYTPRMWNDFSKCISFARIHTSFMWFNNVPELRKVIKERYPQAHQQAGEYCPCDPFMPAVRFIEGVPYFWDSCANLFNMLGGKYCERFGPEHKECFDHLNSASFYSVMMQRMDDNRGFEFAHNEMVKTPKLLQGIWTNVDAYYRQKEIEGYVKCPV